MKSILLLVVCTLAWSAWVAAVLLEKRTRGDKGGISLFPAIPLFPAAAWLSGLGLEQIAPDTGLYILGGLHLFLLALFLGSALISLFRIKKGKVPSGR